MTMPNTPAAPPALGKARELMDFFKTEKVTLALRDVSKKHVTPERLVRAAYLASTRQPALLECTHGSWLVAMMTAGQLGLEPNLIGHAYLVPYGKEVQLQIGYQGLMELVNRSGEAKFIAMRPVFEKDDFEIMYGLEEKLVHRPYVTDPNNQDDSPGILRGVYTVAMHKDGSKSFEWMTKAECDAIRSRSKAGRSGPWVTDYVPMCLKTCAKRHCKRLPKSLEVIEAIELDTAQEIGDVSMTIAPESTPEPKQGKSQTERMKAQFKNAEPIEPEPADPTISTHPPDDPEPPPPDDVPTVPVEPVPEPEKPKTEKKKTPKAQDDRDKRSEIKDIAGELAGGDMFKSTMLKADWSKGKDPDKLEGEELDKVLSRARDAKAAA